VKKSLYVLDRPINLSENCNTLVIQGIGQPFPEMQLSKSEKMTCG